MKGQRAADVVVEYLTELEVDAAASTIRQRRWALRDLLSYVATRRDVPVSRLKLVEILDADLVSDWLSAAAATPSPASPQSGSLPSLRARASAARALLRYATAHNLPAAGTTSLWAATQLPAPPRASTAEHDAVRRLLATAGGEPPAGVLDATWARFGAHLHLLAATGAGETELTALTLADVDASTGTVTVTMPDADATYTLPRFASRAVRTWLTYRTQLVTHLQGSDPKTLWVRIRPAASWRTGALFPAGLPVSDRGLRLAFVAIRHQLAKHDPPLADVDLRSIRRYGQQTASTRTPDTQAPQPVAGT